MLLIVTSLNINFNNKKDFESTKTHKKFDSKKPGLKKQ